MRMKLIIMKKKRKKKKGDGKHKEMVVDGIQH